MATFKLTWKPSWRSIWAIIWGAVIWYNWGWWAVGAAIMFALEFKVRED